MPEPLTSYIVDMHYAFYTLSSHLNNFYNDLLYLADHLASEGNPSSAASVDLARVHIWDLKTDLSEGVTSTRYHLVRSLQWIDTNWDGDGEEYELTMSKILDALWDAKPYQCLLFVPMIDAMRGAIGEKTITEDYMAKALRRFS